MTSITKQLRDVGELLGLDCGDNSCMFAREKTGARTNGGCQCDLAKAVSAIHLAINQCVDQLGYWQDNAGMNPAACQEMKMVLKRVQRGIAARDDAELLRFRAREELVEQLLTAVKLSQQNDDAASSELLEDARSAVRDFKVNT